MAGSGKNGPTNHFERLWAPKNTIELAVLQMQSTRQTELYQKKVEAAKRRREKIQTEYVDDFCNQVERFLNFHPIYKDMGAKMAKLVSSMQPR